MSDLLLAAHRDLALRIARAFACRVPPNVEREDLEQAALIGLWKWCSAHPDSSQPGWRGGLITRVRGAVVDWLRAEDYLPRRARAKEETELQVIRLEDLSSGDGPGWQDLIGEHEESECDARLDAIEALGADMPERERELVLDTFLGGVSQDDLASRLGVSAPRVSQLLTRAKRRMRAHLERRRDIAVPVSVQVLATPKFRVRDFKRELWLARRNALLGHMGGGRSVREAARSLGVSQGTISRWCDSTQMRWVLLTDAPDPISVAVRERGRELIVAALRVEEGSGGRAAPLLRLSRTAICRWRRLLIPDAPQCQSGPRPTVPRSTLVALYERGLTQRQIGKEVGLHHASVAHALATQGLVGRAALCKRPDVTVEACATLVAEGLTHREIAQRFGCSRPLVTKRLRARAS